MVSLLLLCFCRCHEVVFFLAPSQRRVILRQLFSPPSAAAASSPDPEYVGEVFFFFNGLTASQKWKKLQMIRVLTYRRRVCFVITRLLHNKRGVLRGETDKHLDKLNKAIAQSFWGWSVFIFRVLRLVRTSELVCLFGVFFCKRFVESVRKTNYILTFLHVFVFALAVEFICGYTTGQFVIRGR